MNISNLITQMLMEMLEEDGGAAEIKRNELAERLGCVPSQINYVIASRFTPEQGYIVESRRGGGGYIRISRITNDRRGLVMHLINSIGREIDEQACRVNILNLLHQDAISKESARLMAAAVKESCYRGLSPEVRNSLRAAVFKQMLLSTIE